MTSPDMVRILLIRAGQTAWQAAGRVQGDADLPLCDEGAAAADAAAGSLAPDAHVRTLFCGPDEASRQTAMCFAAPMRARVKPMTDLAEINLGVWQGLTEAELADRFGKSFSLWKTEPDRVSVPQGESLAGAAERLTDTVARLISRAGGKPVGLVLHPIMLGLCRRWLQGHGLSDWRDREPTPPVELLEVDPDTLAAPAAARRSA